MRLALWVNGRRGRACFDKLIEAGLRPSLVITHPPDENSGSRDVLRKARQLGIAAISPENPNDAGTVKFLQREGADVFALAGYGRILGRAVLAVPETVSINLHGGRLPQYRGSSPMNWALINGEDSFTLSIIRVEAGVDTGDVLSERRFPIAANDTIVDLHRIAEDEFPLMLLDVLKQVDSGAVVGRKQEERDARYFPLRFPDDGFILWDMLTAEQIHNRVRALRPPYPGATTLVDGRKVVLIGSKTCTPDFFGDPGRIYRKTSTGLLVCAQDKCLWVTEAVFADDDSSLSESVGRYDRLATVREATMRTLTEGVHIC